MPTSTAKAKAAAAAADANADADAGDAGDAADDAAKRERERERERERGRVIATLALTVTLWASAFVAIRFAGRALAPGPLALGRLTVGSVALGVVMLARSEPLPPRRTLGFIVVCGLLWFGLYNVALNAAERRIDAGAASLLVNTAPIFLAVLAGRILREGFPRALMVGCLISFTGGAMIALGVSRQGLQATWGAALCIIAALAYAFGVVAQKPALRSASALSVTWLACTVAAVACLPYAPELVHEISHARGHGPALAWMVYLGLGPTSVGFVGWAYALARTDAGRLGSTTYLVPPLAVLLGWITLGEVPPLLAAPGGILCLAGVAIARRRGPTTVAPSRRPSRSVLTPPSPGEHADRSTAARS
ncbi:MAG: DMT family transporter [Solirubrobacteraceae bacterium]